MHLRSKRPMIPEGKNRHDPIEIVDKSLMDHPVEVWQSNHGQVVAHIELRN